MADHFLSKIRVANTDFVDADGTPVLERHAELHALLSERAGPEVAALFAEPLISRGNDEAPPTVSWYTATPGEPRPLSRLSPAERDRAEAYLADHLRPLKALSDDPATAPLAQGALSVYGSDDIVVVGDRPVIVNWGLMPDAKGANAFARGAHYEATMGRYLPLAGGGARPATSATPAVAAAAASVAATAAAAGPPGGGTPPQGPATDGPTDPPPPRARITPVAWVPLLILLIVAGAVLAWLLMPGTRLFHASDTPPAVTDEDTLNAARALNDSLRDRQALLQTALDGAVCRADGVLIVPGGLTPEGLTPPEPGVVPEKRAKAAPESLLPNAATRVVVPEAGDETNLAAYIEARTVLVLATRGGRLTTGSGFAVGPGLILTNYHVVEPALAEGGQILVTGAALDAPQTATVERTRGPLTATGADFALLKIGAEIPAFPVHTPSQSLKLSNVVAAGFPGDVLEMDINFAALKGGDLSAVPGLTVTDGIINTEQQIGPKTRVLMHSAALSSGNSGGPLVDMCGRLVGVNTFVKQGNMQNRGFALTTADLLAFLDGTGASPEVVTEPCAPVVLRALVATPEPAKE